MKSLFVLICFVLSWETAFAQQKLLTLQQLSRSVRFGTDLGPQDPLELWQSQPIETTIRQMLAHHMTHWFIADIYAQAIGASVAHTHQSSFAWDHLLKLAPQAVIAAANWQAQSKTEPFFRTHTHLIDWTPVVRNQGRILTDQALIKHRKIVINDASVYLKTLRDQINTEPDKNLAWQILCESDLENVMVQKLNQFGVPSNVLTAVKRQWFVKLETACMEFGDELNPLGELIKLSESLINAFNYFQTIPVARVTPTGLNQIIFYSNESLSLLPTWFQTDQWVSLTNTLSNRNRKRAHFVLQKFFCTKLGIPPPEIHFNDSKTCSTCHRQLDPLAGLFKSIGNQGSNFINQKLILFDGGSAMRLLDYERYWQDDSSPNGWNIGYVDRSGTKINLNDLADLEILLQNHETVQTCWVRHVGQYLWPRLTLSPTATTEIARHYAQTLKSKGWHESIVQLVTALTQSYVGQHE